MYNENNIPYFEGLITSYQELYDNIENTILNDTNFENLNALTQISQQFNFFDIKLRMAFAISDISLNEQMMRRKYGDLKLCHLMLYKLADLWFAYEAFFKLYKFINSKEIQSKIIWLNQNTNSEYQQIQNIVVSLTRLNNELKQKFDTNAKREHLKNYLTYCRNNSQGGQSNRLQNIIDKIQTESDLPVFSESEILTITYSIRNNFAHNGETTVTTPELSYSEKKDLAIILYEFLAILILAITINVINKKIEEFE
jgi:hypothetical protein